MREQVIEFVNELKQSQSQDEKVTAFTARLGIPRTVWYSWQKGASVPTPELVRRVGKAVGWPSQRILEWQAIFSSSTDILEKAQEIDNILKKYSILNKNYLALSEINREKLIKYWKELGEDDSMYLDFGDLKLD